MATTPLSGKVESAPPGAIGFDINTPLTAKTAKDYRARDFRFCVRYLTRAKSPGNPGDLTRAEAEIILASGLALMAVQHVASPGWVASAELGDTYGLNAARNAQNGGLPPGVNVWLDLEELRLDTPRQAVIDYCNAWFAQVEKTGYVSGVYVGVNVVLSPDDLFLKLKTAHYWKSGSHVPDIPHRGWQMIQTIPHKDDDQSHDTDVTRTDALGGNVQWLIRP